jgi:nucleoside 2-deoxyribosyltransferase
MSSTQSQQDTTITQSWPETQKITEANNSRAIRAALAGRFKVYLAGPITGLSYGESTDWRDYASRLLAPEIIGYSPMRNKKYLAQEKEIASFYQAEHPLSTPKGIMTRDYWDVHTSDLVLVNFIGADKVSIGTVMEVAFAHAHRVPVVMAMEEGNLHTHPMMEQATGYVAPTLEKAIEYVRHFLLPGELIR